MKHIYTLLLSTCVFVSAFAQNVGIGTSTPQQKLEVAGWIELGDESEGSSGTAGSVRYHSLGKIQFHNGTVWVDILSTGNSGDYIQNQNTSAQAANYWIDGSGSVGSIRFRELPANGNNFIALKSPDALSADYSFTLPGSYGTSNQVLVTNGSGTLSWTTASTIIGTDNDANDGLTVSYPDIDLNVNNGLSLNSDNVQLGGTLIQATTITQGNNAFTIANNNASNTVINLSSTGDFEVQDNGTTALFVRDNGTVGIGTNAPAYLLHLASNGNTYMALERASANTSGNQIYGLKSRGTVASPTVITSGDDLLLLRAYGNDGTADVESGRLTFDSEGTISTGIVPGIIRFYTASTSGTLTQRMVINSSGDAGIGTSSPSSRLEVANSGTTEVRISSTSGFGAGQLSFISDLGSANEWRPAYLITADNGSFTGRLDFCTNGTGSGNKFGSVTGMSLNNGNLGIGTTSPVARLEVNGGRVEFTATTDASGTAGSGVLEIANALRFDGNEIITNTNAALYIQNDNNGDLVVDAGTLYIDASADNVGVYTNSPSRRLHLVDDFVGNYAVIMCDNPSDDTGVRSDQDAWGLIGFSNYRWWRMYAYDGYYTSHTKFKAEVSYLTNEDLESRLQDIRNIQSIRFKWKKQLEEKERGLSIDCREHTKGESPDMSLDVPLNLGFAVESLPKELLDETGENYSSSGMFGLLIAATKALDMKVDRVAQGQYAASNKPKTFDGGSVRMEGNELWVLFSEEFSKGLAADKLPFVTVTSNKPTLTLSVVEKSTKGFKVVSAGNIQELDLFFDWIAMGQN